MKDAEVVKRDEKELTGRVVNIDDNGRDLDDPDDYSAGPYYQKEQYNRDHVEKL